MSLDPKIRASLTLPPICAPMFPVTGPALAREACKAGVIGGLPRQNARSLEEFEAWLAEITQAPAAHHEARPAARIAPIAVNYPTRVAPDDLAANAEPDRCGAPGRPGAGVREGLNELAAGRETRRVGCTTKGEDA